MVLKWIKFFWVYLFKSFKTSKYFSKIISLENLDCIEFLIASESWFCSKISTILAANASWFSISEISPLIFGWIISWIPPLQLLAKE